MTASLASEPWRAAIEFGAADFIVKPFSLSTFRESCGLVLDTHRARPSNVVDLAAHRVATERQRPFG